LRIAKPARSYEHSAQALSGKIVLQHDPVRAQRNKKDNLTRMLCQLIARLMNSET
jgi:hypothetical protein